MLFIPGKKWYVLHTKENAEKKVLNALTRKNISCYLPLLTQRKQHWDGNFSIAQNPLFPELLFVHISDADIYTVRSTEGVKNFLYWLSSYAIMNDGEIAIIKDYVGKFEKIWLKKIPVNPDKKTWSNSWVMHTLDKVNKSVLPTLGFEIYASEINVVSDVNKYELVNLIP